MYSGMPGEYHLRFVTLDILKSPAKKNLIAGQYMKYSVSEYFISEYIVSEIFAV